MIINQRFETTDRHVSIDTWDDSPGPHFYPERAGRRMATAASPTGGSSRVRNTPRPDRSKEQQPCPR
jgi:hypothetical protein